MRCKGGYMKKSKKPIEQQSPLEQEISSQPAAEVQAIVDAQPTVDSGAAPAHTVSPAAPDTGGAASGQSPP